MLWNESHAVSTEYTVVSLKVKLWGPLTFKAGCSPASNVEPGIIELNREKKSITG
jgi:hypothetical protein